MAHREIPDQTPRHALHWFVAVTIVTVSVCAFFSPLLAVYPELRIASTHPDALEFIWTTWRLDGVLSGARPLYYTNELFAPRGASLLLHTVCEGILLPITAALQWLNPVWRYNTALVLMFLLSGISALGLFRALGCAPIAAAIASLLVLFCPANIGHLHAGHLNFITLFGLLEMLRGLVLFAGLSSRRTPALVSISSLRYALGVTALCFTNLYYLYFGALLVGATTLLASLTKQISNRARLRETLSMSAPFVVGLLPALPHLIDVALLSYSGTYSPDHRASDHGADLSALFTPSPVQRIGQGSFAASLRKNVTLHTGESSLYLGLSLIIGALLGCFIGGEKSTRRSRFFALTAIIFAILSCGPTVSLHGIALGPNPFDRALRSLLPMYPSVPARFAYIAVIALIASASQLLLAHQRGRTRVLGATLFALAALEFAPVPLGVYPLPLPSPALVHLAQDSDATIVADLSHSPQYAMLRQTIHEKPIAGGFLSRHPRREGSLLRRNRFIKLSKGELSVSNTDALRDWCALGANRVIVERAVAHSIDARLKELGFIEVTSDPYVTLYAPRTTLCVNDKQPVL
jgi:hypothetical protein